MKLKRRSNAFSLLEDGSSKFKSRSTVPNQQHINVAKSCGVLTLFCLIEQLEYDIQVKIDLIQVQIITCWILPHDHMMGMYGKSLQ